LLHYDGIDYEEARPEDRVGILIKDMLKKLLIPEFTNPENQRRAKILVVTQLVVLIIVLAIIFYTNTKSPEQPKTLLQGSLAIVAMIVSYIMLRMGRINLASWLIAVPGWMIFTIDLGLVAGIRGVSILGQILMVIFSGLAINGKLALVMTIFTLAANFFILWLEQNGILVTPMPLGANNTRWFMQTVYIILAALYIWAADQVIRESLSKSKKTADQYRALYEQTSDGVILLGLDWIILSANSQAHKMLGYEDGELEGFDVDQKRDTNDPGLIALRKYPILEGLDLPSYEAIMNHLGGSEFDVEINLALVKDDKDNPQHIQCILRDITERKAYERQLQYQALYDPLTNLPNRILFDHRYQQAHFRADEDPTQVAVLFVDLDDFKSVNDDYGHAVGDQVLQELGGRLHRALRETDTVARLGGDEFVIILENTQIKEDVERIANKLIKEISEPLFIEDHEIRMTASIGINISKRSDLPEIDLVKTSDTAMYQVKEKGKNDFLFYDEYNKD
jgi:diguanylate cyclase (GGDEF)-like protein/PAS domain S-box-containing protein